MSRLVHSFSANLEEDDILDSDSSFDSIRWHNKRKESIDEALTSIF